MTTTMPLTADVMVANSFDSVTYTYLIEFEDFYSRTFDYYDTKEFKPSVLCQPSFTFRLHPKKKWRNNKFYTLLQFYLFKTKKRFKLQYCVSVLGKGDEKKFTCVNSVYFQKKNKFCFFICWPKLIDVLDEMLKTNCKLTFYCELTFLTEIIENKSGITLYQMNRLEKQLIVDNLTELYNAKKHTDVTLIVAGTSFVAHKAILSSRSPVFAAMFDHDTLEQQQNRVEITDVDVKIFEVLLCYVYTGKVPIVSYAALCDLLAAANKYQLESLKAICEQSLTYKLSPATVHQLMVLADLHDAKNLKERAVNYLKKNTQKAIESMLENYKIDDLMTTFSELIIKSMAE